MGFFSFADFSDIDSQPIFTIYFHRNGVLLHGCIYCHFQEAWNKFPQAMSVVLSCPLWNDTSQVSHYQSEIFSLMSKFIRCFMCKRGFIMSSYWWPRATVDALPLFLTDIKITGRFKHQKTFATSTFLVHITSFFSSRNKKPQDEMAMRSCIAIPPAGPVCAVLYRTKELSVGHRWVRTRPEHEFQS